MKRFLLVLGAMALLASLAAAQNPLPLETNVNTIKLWEGGVLEFKLDAGAANGGRYYYMFGGMSGSSPGFPLPGGSVTVPVNWDLFTTLLVNISFPGFLGMLDNAGTKTVPITIMPMTGGMGFTATFAYALAGPPWDFASNAVTVDFIAGPPPEYKHDDGSSEKNYGLSLGGQICWMHAFKTVGASEDIASVSSAFGCPANPGMGPFNGATATFLIWEDPNDDGDPKDAVCLDAALAVVQNVDTDQFTEAEFYNPVTVKGVFFVGCVVDYKPGQMPVPLDFGAPAYNGEAWLGGDATFFDYKGLQNNDIPPFELSTSGIKAYFLLRAMPD